MFISIKLGQGINCIFKLDHKHDYLSCSLEHNICLPESKVGISLRIAHALNCCVELSIVETYVRLWALVFGVETYDVTILLRSNHRYTHIDWGVRPKSWVLLHHITMHCLLFFNLAGSWIPNLLSSWSWGPTTSVSNRSLGSIVRILC